MDLDEQLGIYASVPRGYYEWMLDALRPDLRGPVLEIGSGPGIVTALLLDRGFEVVGTDVDSAAVDRLRGLFATRTGFSPVVADAESDALLETPGGPFHTVLCLNVLEHLADDIGALRRFSRLLAPGGAVAVVVPALPALFGPMDARFGHRRRYTREGLKRALGAAGLRARVRYWNLAGVPGWWWRFRLLRRRDFGRLDNRLFELVLPALRAIEGRFEVPLGLSLVAVGRPG